jgi:hypothetical protein
MREFEREDAIGREVVADLIDEFWRKVEESKRCCRHVM